MYKKYNIRYKDGILFRSINVWYKILYCKLIIVVVVCTRLNCKEFYFQLTSHFQQEKNVGNISFWNNINFYACSVFVFWRRSDVHIKKIPKKRISTAKRKIGLLFGLFMCTAMLPVGMGAGWVKSLPKR